VVVEAAGFNTQTTEASMDDQGNSQELTVDMTASQVLFAVPDLFGRALVEARKAITDAGLQLIRVVDSHGASIAPADLPDEALNQAVLAQAPEAGSMVLANSPISVSISAKAEFVERVQVPDIRGLSIEEAKAKLQAVGLVLGETGSVGR
jgi:beta-lactam-binding protein with PASTA domain